MKEWMVRRDFYKIDRNAAFHQKKKKQQQMSEARLNAKKIFTNRSLNSHQKNKKTSMIITTKANLQILAKLVKFHFHT